MCKLHICIFFQYLSKENPTNGKRTSRIDFLLLSLSIQIKINVHVVIISFFASNELYVLTSI